MALRRHRIIIIIIISPCVQHLYRIQHLELFLDLLASIVAAAIFAYHVRLCRSPPRGILAHKWRRPQSRDVKRRLLGGDEAAKVSCLAFAGHLG